MTPLSRRLLVAVFCFAVSVPALAGALFQLHIQERVLMSIRFTLLYGVGILLSLVGIGALFFHFHYAIGITFIIAVIVAFFLVDMSKTSQTLPRQPTT